uniref:BTB domain-containing protein n=1 Tax=Strongyloides papillosus TaxID=174720 RepID=A0A0N5BY04_STREA
MKNPYLRIKHIRLAIRREATEKLKISVILKNIDYHCLNDDAMDDYHNLSSSEILDIVEKYYSDISQEDFSIYDLLNLLTHNLKISYEGRQPFRDFFKEAVDRMKFYRLNNCDALVIKIFMDNVNYRLRKDSKFRELVPDSISIDDWCLASIEMDKF